MKIMVIDGNSILNRAFYGIRQLTNHEGLPTNAVYGFLATLFKLQDEEDVYKRQHIGNLRQIRKQGKGRSSKRKENRRLSFLFAPPRRAPQRSRRPQTANPPAEVQRKTLRPERANSLTQFEHPAQSMQKKEPPVRANPPAAVRAPRSAGAENPGNPEKIFPAEKTEKRPFSR